MVWSLVGKYSHVARRSTADGRYRYTIIGFIRPIDLTRHRHMRNDIEQKTLEEPATPTGPTRLLPTIAGLICVALAAAGAVLPLLPTTPFLLLAAACFARGSPRLHRWLHTNPLFGVYLRRYRQGEGIPLAAKIATLTLLWLSLTASALWAVPESLWPIRVALVLVGLCVSYLILRTPTYRRNRDEPR